jgi:hypothetical protein
MALFTDRFIAAFVPAQLLIALRIAKVNTPVLAGFGVRSVLILRCVVMAETKSLKIGLRENLLLR